MPFLKFQFFTVRIHPVRKLKPLTSAYDFMSHCLIFYTIPGIISPVLFYPDDFEKTGLDCINVLLVRECSVRLVL